MIPDKNRARLSAEKAGKKGEAQASAGQARPTIPLGAEDDIGYPLASNPSPVQPRPAPQALALPHPAPAQPVI